MKKILSILLLSLFVSNISFADFSLKDWQYVKTILPSNSSSPYTKVILDGEVYIHSNLNDLRIINSANTEVPFKLVEETERNDKKNTYSTVLDSSIVNGQSMAILDTNNSGVVHSSLKLILQGRSFNKKVSIYASDTKLSHFDSGWRSISSSGYIFGFYDNTTKFYAGDTTVYYPKTSSRYIRVVLSGGEGDLPMINSAYTTENIVSSAQTESEEFPLSIKNNSKEKTTELSVDFGVKGVPVNKITLSTADKNWNRYAVVQVADLENGPWTKVSENYLYSINQALYSGVNLSLSFPETKSRYLRIIVSNYDDAPVNFDSKIKVFRNQRAVFFKTSSSPLKLYYGNNKAVTPYYDFNKIFSYADESNISSSNLGSEDINPGYIAPAVPKKTFTEKYPQALNIILVILVVCLAGLMFVVVKKTKGGQ